MRRATLSGDEIHYKAGSPTQHGIADNSTATILSVDARANILTVATRDGNEVSYNPALLKKLTGQSTVYREDQRDLAVGERIKLTASDREAHLRSGDFATVERFGEGNTFSVRLDTGKSLELDSDQARHIEYGYAVESSTLRLWTAFSSRATPQLAEQQETLARLSPHIRDLALYTSDSSAFAREKTLSGAEIRAALGGLIPKVNITSEPSLPEINLEEFGISL